MALLLIYLEEEGSKQLLLEFRIVVTIGIDLLGKQLKLFKLWVARFWRNLLFEPHLETFAVVPGIQ